MAPSLTGIVDSFVAFSLLVLAWRLFLSWQKTRTRPALLLFWITVFYVVFFAAVALGGIFFAQDSRVLLAVDVAGAVTQLGAGILGTLLIFSLWFPRRSALFGLIPIVLVGVWATLSTALYPTLPFAEGRYLAINWNYDTLEALPRLLVLLATFFPLFVFFVRTTPSLASIPEKGKALGLGGIFLGGIVSTLFDFFLERHFSLPAESGDLVLAFVGLLILGVSLFSPRDTTRGLPQRGVT